MCFYKNTVHFQLLIKLFAYHVQNWRRPNIVHSQSAANWVYRPRLHQWRLRGARRVSGQCLWVVDCASDHADSWLLTTSDRWSREQCCWHASSQAVLSQNEEDVRSHRLCDAAHASVSVISVIMAASRRRIRYHCVLFSRVWKKSGLLCRLQSFDVSK